MLIRREDILDNTEIARDIYLYKSLDEQKEILIALSCYEELNENSSSGIVVARYHPDDIDIGYYEAQVVDHSLYKPD